MANVYFKRGLQASLPTASANIEDGAFYLTTDTNRLYVGKKNASNQNVLVELNQSINIVPTLGSLPTNTTSQDVGQFYYISGSNILCVYVAKGTNPETYEWKQINPDTSLTPDSGNIGVASVTNGAIVTDTVTDSKSNTSTGSFTIKGDSNLNVTVNGNEITLAPNIAHITGETNTTYTIGTSAHTGGGADINLTSSDSTPVVDTVSIVGGGATSVTQASDTITITTPQPVATTEVTFTDQGVLRVGTSVNSQDSTAGTYTPKIKLGTNNDEYKFISGTATLPVYTKTETDSAISTALGAANAMTYKGTVSNSDASTKLASTGNVGDTYKASTNITADSTNGIPAAKTGDLIIAEGTDGNVTWVVIPSGDDQTITGETRTSGITINDQSGPIAEIDVVGSAADHIDATGSITGKKTTITVKQRQDYTAQDVEGSTANVTQTATNSAEFTAVTAIETDAYGNVVNSSIKTKKFTVVDTHNHLTDITATVATSNGVSTVTLQPNDADGSTITAASFSVGSSSLTLSNSGTAITANLEWGTF